MVNKYRVSYKETVLSDRVIVKVFYLKQFVRCDELIELFNNGLYFLKKYLKIAYVIFFLKTYSISRLLRKNMLKHVKNSMS